MRYAWSQSVLTIIETIRKKNKQYIRSAIGNILIDLKNKIGKNKNTEAVVILRDPYAQRPSTD